MSTVLSAVALTKQAVAAHNAGDKPQAAALLIRAVQADPGYEMAWLWLSSCLADQAERRYCIEQALKANPQSVPAQRGMAQIGPGSSRPPAGLVEEAEVEPPPAMLVPVAKPRRSLRFLAVLLLVVIVAAAVVGGFMLQSQQPLTAASPLAQPATCDAQPFLVLIEPLAREWDDANTLADQTPRASLAIQIDKLQSIRRRVQDLTAPQCAFLVKQRLVDTMDNSINGYLAFLAQKPDSEVSRYFDQAKRSMADFTKEVQTLK